MANQTLKAYRMLKGVKQENIAEILGITLTTYSNKETGKTQFSLRHMKINNKSKVAMDIFHQTRRLIALIAGLLGQLANVA